MAVEEFMLDPTAVEVDAALALAETSVQSTTVTAIAAMTQAEYDALTPVATTFYIITSDFAEGYPGTPKIAKAYFGSIPVFGSTPWWLTGGIDAANVVAAYQPKGAANLAASYVNLANPGTYNAAPGVAPTIGADGWVFTGSEYLDTGIIPQRGWSVIFKYSEVTSNYGYLFGVSEAANNAFYYRPQIAQSVFANGTNYTYAASLQSSRVVCIAGTSLYVSGSLIGSVGGSSETQTLPVVIGGLNTSGVTGNFVAGKIQAAAYFNTILPAERVLALSTAMNAI